MAFARRTMRCSSSPSLTIFTRSARSAALRKLRFVFTRRLESIPLIRSNGFRMSAESHYIVPCNREYAILKEFAVLEKTPNVPGLDLPTLDIVSTAKGFGCAAVEARTREEIQAAFSQALNAEGPTVIAVPVKSQIRSLLGTGSAA